VHLFSSLTERAKVLTQHLGHLQQLFQQQTLLSCNAQMQEIMLFQNQLHKRVISFHLPSAHSLLSFSLLSPPQTILVSLLLLFCHSFLEKKSTHCISAIQ